MNKEFLFRRIEDPMKQPGQRGASRARLPDLANLVGSKVYDSEMQDVGRLHCIWEDDTHQASFLGVKTGWLGMGAIHVVPANTAQYNESTNTIKVPFTKDKIKDAPSYDVDDEMDASRQREIWNYYGQQPFQGSQNFEQSAPSPEQSRSTAEKEGRDLILEERGSRAPETPRTTESAARRQEEARIPLHEEELKIGKRETEVGGVRLRKIIRTETVQQPVELKREELVVEKVEPSGTTSNEQAFQEEDIFIPLRAEEPVVEKQTRVREEVRVRKEATGEQRTVSDSVRKEEVQTERQGQVEEEPEPHHV